MRWRLIPYRNGISYGLKVRLKGLFLYVNRNGNRSLKPANGQGHLERITAFAQLVNFLLVDGETLFMGHLNSNRTGRSLSLFPA